MDAATLQARRAHPAGDLRPRGRLSGRYAEHSNPVAVGRGLLLVVATLVGATVSVLHPDRAAWLVLAGLAVAVSVLLLLTFLLPWSRLPGWCTLLFPVSVWAVLAMLGLGTDGLAAPYVGVFVLCFAYIGLTQPARTGLCLVPPAGVAYVAALGGPSATLGVRLVVAVVLWVLMSQLLAELTVRQRTLTEALRRAAHTDVLTGVANRRDLDLRLAAARAGDSVVICDLDHFKALNDSLGHAAGDLVLAEFGSLLRVSLREQDYGARYGGEEFALVLPGTTVTEATATLSRLRKQWALLQPTVTFSAGVADIGAERSPEAALAAADRALYAAKDAGRNCDRVAHPLWGTAPGEPSGPRLRT